MKKYAIGIDLGGTNIAAGLVDLEEKRIVESMSVKTRAPRPVGEIAADIAAEAEELCRRVGIEKRDLCRIGVATPGIVQGGVVLTAVNLGWTDAPLADEIRRATGIENAFVANDANAAALGEALWGCGAGCDSLVAITLGTGVGGGIILDGKIWEGFNGFAAEIGHMVIRQDGLLCGCGKRGCFESYCSATALIRDTKAAMAAHPESALYRYAATVDAVGGKTAFLAAKENDEAAKEVVHNFIEALAIGVSNVINMLQPDVVCIGGGISREGDNLMNPLCERVKELTFGYKDVRSKVVAATLRNDAGIIGAALLDA